AGGESRAACAALGARVADVLARIGDDGAVFFDADLALIAYRRAMRARDEVFGARVHRAHRSTGDLGHEQSVYFNQVGVAMAAVTGADVARGDHPNLGLIELECLGKGVAGAMRVAERANDGHVVTAI